MTWMGVGGSRSLPIPVRFAVHCAATTAQVCRRRRPLPGGQRPLPGSPQRRGAAWLCTSLTPGGGREPAAHALSCGQDVGSLTLVGQVHPDWDRPSFCFSCVYDAVFLNYDCRSVRTPFPPPCLQPAGAGKQTGEDEWCCQGYAERRKFLPPLPHPLKR